MSTEQSTRARSTRYSKNYKDVTNLSSWMRSVEARANRSLR
jgi:hypothetical protein